MTCQLVERHNQIILANRHLALTVDMARGHYTLTSSIDELPARLDARTDMVYRPTGARPRSAWPGRVTHWRHQAIQDVHGNGLQVCFELTPLTRHLGVQLQAQIYDHQPFVALRLVVSNHSAHPIAIESFSPVQALPRDRGGVRLGAPGIPLSFFKNGYQAWSFAGALQADQTDVTTRLGPLSGPQLLNPLTPRSTQRGVFGSEMFALLGNVASGVGLVTGQLTSADQFTAIGTDCRREQAALQVICQADGVRLAPGEQMASEWVYLQIVDLRDDDPLADYAVAVGRQMRARVPAQVKTGWCSWYYFFQNVREEDFIANLDHLAQLQDELPLQVVQLDDGYQTDVGDWLSINDKFPHGLTWLSQQVKARGLTPGLWLAPFIVKPTARMEDEHPDWLLKDKRGRPVSSGYNWWQWTHALDMTHPGAQDYVRQVIETAVREWGFPYLKLDFLYAAALPARRYDSRTTRAQALRQGLELIRAAAGDETFLLGCGCPLGPGIGIFDANRIGPDVAPTWRPRVFGTQIFFGQEPGLPAARNAIRNTLARSALHGRWWHNDPDCLLARSEPAGKDEVGLTENEVCSLASIIGLSGGLVLSSDNLPALPPERRRYLTALLPALGQSAAPLDLLHSDLPDVYVLRMQREWDEWVVVGLFNWADHPRRLALNLARLRLPAAPIYHAFDFWNERYYRVSGGQLVFDNVPPHGCHVVALRPALNKPQLIATTFHITMGGEITRFESSLAENTGRLTLDLGRTARGEVWLNLPGVRQARATCNAQPAPITSNLPGIWIVEANIISHGNIVVTWS